MNRLYNDLAHLWTLVSSPEEYVEEAGYWRDTLQVELGPGRHRILELGVGGGNNLSHLTPYFDATGVDLSPHMLENSRRLNPGVEHFVGDMRTVRLGRTFDAVIIHDAICYMLSESDLAATFATAALHLRPGGVFVTAPDWFTETFKSHVEFTVRSDHKPEFTFVECYADPDPSDTTVESLYLYVWSEPTGLRLEQDRHIQGLFPMNTWLRVMAEAGFAVSRRPYPVEGGGGWFLIGRKRGE